jgi:hypothetical protein
MSALFDGSRPSDRLRDFDALRRSAPRHILACAASTDEPRFTGVPNHDGGQELLSRRSGTLKVVFHEYDLKLRFEIFYIGKNIWLSLFNS